MTLEEGRVLLATCELHSLLGLELVELAEGRACFTLVPPAIVRAGEGTPLHGGALATALDTAATFAVISSVGKDAATVDLRVDYLRPALATSSGSRRNATRRSPPRLCGGHRL